MSNASVQNDDLMEIKYSYAKGTDGKLVHIGNATQGATYYCPQCGNEMIPKMGIINAHHFAHKVECSCNGESYLHKVAKEKFKEIYDKSLEFILEYRKPINCPLHYDSKSCVFANELCNGYERETMALDLKKTFDQCLIEEAVLDGQFRADILLKDSTGKVKKSLLIEFYHTHRCEIDKINCGYPIVELKIDTEEDIITSSRIKFNDKVSLYGFKINPYKGENLYYVSFEDDSDASDLRVEKYNCIEVFKKNYADEYQCSDAFVVAIDPASYQLFCLDSRIGKNPPSVGAVACAIAYSKGFRKFENCAGCVNSRRSQYHDGELWCRESKNNPDLPKNPKGVDVYQCHYFFPNIDRIRSMAKHIKNLKFEVLRCDLPIEFDESE